MTTRDRNFWEDSASESGIKARKEGRSTHARIAKSYYGSAHDSQFRDSHSANEKDRRSNSQFSSNGTRHIAAEKDFRFKPSDPSISIPYRASTKRRERTAPESPPATFDAEDYISHQSRDLQVLLLGRELSNAQADHFENTVMFKSQLERLAEIHGSGSKESHQIRGALLAMLERQMVMDAVLMRVTDVLCNVVLDMSQQDDKMNQMRWLKWLKSFVWK